ncbi:type II toxin-antitoxin system RelE/ParE family toxin [Amycolatopsis sp. FBCC-B4732]|uniref:type II toxin-antitoxin system RelE/ParE family toxin n=1 Tax=Amycolatopsis sp. FBCC-B4732 TaxID=3079339 RepID=UPI001FF438F4|nr:type II toxin-antitoxin system RelE/ParE family toxin [Amycolatopsis sp. FBCC-B4732]UOX87835.1 type II toxin-antitoxin system RelE/ParE family toxin [Amycolatopsis sp. FBCC-B4732]
MEWEIELHDEVDRWFVDLCRTDPVSADRVEEAIDVLAREGPGLGRPLVDRVHGSRLHNLKELRPASAGASEIRILFAFDPVRRAVLLVAGDKAGNWKGWYDRNIPVAELRFREHLSHGAEG